MDPGGRHDDAISGIAMEGRGKRGDFRRDRGRNADALDDWESGGGFEP